MLSNRKFKYNQYSQTWSNYVAKTNHREQPLDFLRHLVNLQKASPSPRYAADIGCGAGNELVYLLESGYHVLGIDGNLHAVKESSNKCKDFNNWQVVQHDLNLPSPKIPMQDLIYSYAVLFFLERQAINDLIIYLSKKLNPNGLIGFNLIGPKDEWATTNNDVPVSVYSEEQIIALLKSTGLNVIDFTEHEHDSSLASGEVKHWHEFRIVGRNIVRTN